MMDNGKMTSLTEKVQKLMEMELFTKENLKMDKNMMMMENLNGETEKFIEGNLEMDIWMVKGK